MLNLDLINKKYHNFEEIKNDLSEIEEKTNIYYKKHQKELDYLKSAYEILKQNPSSWYHQKYGMSIANNFLYQNPLLAEYEKLLQVSKDYRNSLAEARNDTGVVEPFQRFIALKHDNDDDYDLLELYTRERINLKGYSKEKVEYIIGLLRSASSFICYAERKDLPLIMNILDELDYNSDYYDVEPEDVAEESYYDEISKCHNMELQFIRAHMMDNKQEELREKFNNNNCRVITERYFDETTINKLLRKLNLIKDKKSEESYKEAYYYILMLKGNIEKIYVDAPAEDKKIVIDAYLKLSQGLPVLDFVNLNRKHIEYRTASSIVNIEVLKRKNLRK